MFVFVPSLASMLQMCLGFRVEGCPRARCCCLWLDMGLIGETCGPFAQRGLRRSTNFDVAKWKSLVHGALLARGAQQKSDEGEAPVPRETEVAIIHSGGRPDVQASVRQIFRLVKKQADREHGRLGEGCLSGLQ